MIRPTLKCHRCGSDAMLEHSDEPTVCYNCCEHPDHEYDRDRLEYCCIGCGKPAPDDFYSFDDQPDLDL